MILRTLKQFVTKPAISTKAVSSNYVLKAFNRQLLTKSCFKPQFYNFSRSFATSSSKTNFDLDEVLEGVGVGEVELESFKEPYIPDEDMNEINTLRRSLSQNINLGDYRQAHEDAQNYIGFIKKYYGTNHPALFSALNNLALIYKLVGEHQSAKVLYTKIIEGYLKFFGHQHLSTVTVMQNLANLLREMQEHESAIKIYEDVLGIRRELQPEKKIEQAVCQSSMAGAYRELGQFQKSEDCLEEALEIFQKELGENHLNTATCLNNMALTCKKQKKFEKAEKLYLRSLKTREQLLNELHPDVIAVKHNLGELYVAMGDQEKARDYMIEAMEAIRKLEEQKA